MPETPPLNFERAEFGSPGGGLACQSCQAPLVGEYHAVNGHPICGECRARMETALGDRGSFGRALLYGLGGALAGSAIYYAVLALLHIEFGLIAVVVGVLVGKAVRKGAGGQGGRRYQVLALVLTYLAISSSYVPLVLAEMQQPASASGWVVRAIFTAALSLVFPFLMLASGFSGILSIVIMGIGLWEAWKFTQGRTVHFTGPYHVAAAEGSAASKL